MNPEELARRFKHHPPPDERTVGAHENIRSDVGIVALRWNEVLPESREKSLALTALQEAMMWANAGIAIHGPK